MKKVQNIYMIMMEYYLFKKLQQIYKILDQIK